MIDIHVDYLDKKNIQNFWQEVEKQSIPSCLDIYLNHECASIMAIDCSNENEPVIIVNLFALEDCMEWSNLADSDISDEEYHHILGEKIEPIMSMLKHIKPKKINDANYSSSWFDDSRYIGLYAKTVEIE